MNNAIPVTFEYTASDYHEFGQVKHVIKKALGVEYSFEEVGFDGLYYAIFWRGEKPVELIESRKKKAC